MHYELCIEHCALNSSHLHTRAHFAVGTNHHKATVGILSTEYHALLFHTLEGAWWEISDEAHFLANEVLGLIVLSDA